MALKICNKAYEKHPDSVEIIRSLSRIYLKKENYLKGYELIKLSAEKEIHFLYGF